MLFKETYWCIVGMSFLQSSKTTANIPYQCCHFKKKANILIGDKHSTFEPLKNVRSQFEVKFSELIRIIKLENTLYKIARHFSQRS